MFNLSTAGRQELKMDHVFQGNAVNNNIKYK